MSVGNVILAEVHDRLVHDVLKNDDVWIRLFALAFTAADVDSEHDHDEIVALAVNRFAEIAKREQREAARTKKGKAKR